MEVERAELLSVRASQGLCGETLMPLQIPRDAANACPVCMPSKSEACPHLSEALSLLFSFALYDSGLCISLLLRFSLPIGHDSVSVLLCLKSVGESTTYSCFLNELSAVIE